MNQLDQKRLIEILASSLPDASCPKGRLREINKVKFASFMNMIRLPDLLREEMAALIKRYQHDRQLLRDDLLKVCLYRYDSQSLAGIEENSKEMSLSLKNEEEKEEEEEKVLQITDERLHNSKPIKICMLQVARPRSSSMKSQSKHKAFFNDNNYFAVDKKIESKS